MDKTKQLRQLQQQKADLVKQADELLTKENATDDDVKKAEDLQNQVATLNKKMSLLENQIALEKETAATTITEADMAAAQVKSSEKKMFANFGEQLQAIAKSSIPGATVDARLLEVQAAASGGAAAVPSDGGYLIQSDFARQILKNVYETGILASRCRTPIEISANSNKLTTYTLDETSRATGSRLGGVRVYRANEADTVTASKPKIGKIELQLEKLMGLAYITDELMEDAAAMESIYTEAFQDEFKFILDDEIFRGTGAGQCLGILNSDALVTVAKETGQEADTIVKENIDKMWSRMWAPSRANAVWLINQEIEPQLESMAITIGTGGVPVYLPTGGLADTPYARLKGRPVIPIEHCAALGDVGDIALVDLQQYMLIKKGGLKSDSSMHVRFIYGENTFRFTMRNNGQPIWRSPLTPYKATSGNTLSPFVTLAAR